ncbi:MAG: PilN domain-containing protein [Nitrospinota bacterium]
MIKINLIYDRKEIEIRKVKKEFLCSVIFTLLVGSGVGYVWAGKTGEVEELTRHVADAEAEKTRLSAVGRKIKKFEQIKKSIDKRINAIAALLDDKKGPARVFDELNSLIPADMWLISIRESGGRISIVGFAFSNPGIANFMDNLKQGRFFSNVELNGIDQITISDESVKKFTLSARVVMTKQAKKI